MASRFAQVNSALQRVEEVGWKSKSANEVVEYGIRAKMFDKANEAKELNSVTKRPANSRLSLLPVVLLLRPIFVVAGFFAVLILYRGNRPAKETNVGARWCILRGSLAERRLDALRLSGRDLEIIFDDFGKYSPKDMSRAWRLSEFYRFDAKFLLSFFWGEYGALVSDCVIGLQHGALRNFLFHLVRLPHLGVFQLSYRNFLIAKEPLQVISFEMISRFSTVLHQTNEMFGVEGIGYLHGLEYSFPFPHGMYGNQIFCSSEEAARELNKKMPRSGSQKFKYDKEVSTRLFKVDVQFSSHKSVVYYTDSRHPEDDYKNLAELAPVIDFVKLHPNDSKKNYQGLQLKYLTSFDESLACGVAVMRPSTVIFEAAVSGVTTICLTSNEKEQYMYEELYPSLSASGLRITEAGSNSAVKQAIESQR